MENENEMMMNLRHSMEKMEITKDPKDFFEIIAHFNTMAMDFVEETLDVNCVKLGNDRWLFNFEKNFDKKTTIKTTVQ